MLLLRRLLEVACVLVLARVAAASIWAGQVMAVNDLDSEVRS